MMIVIIMDIHRFSCAVNYILEILCSYILASAKLGTDRNQHVIFLTPV
jgi:hypothetical protein